jgi:tetratricopeptide (TPR) repeat protein
MRALAILMALASAPAFAESAPPMKPEARAHLVRGLEHYEKGRFAEAVSEFLAGQAIDPQPEFRYALGQAERKRGRCAEAIVYYQSYLDTRPSAVQAATARQNIERCKATASELPPAPPGGRGGLTTPRTDAAARGSAPGARDDTTTPSSARNGAAASAANPRTDDPTGNAMGGQGGASRSPTPGVATMPRPSAASDWRGHLLWSLGAATVGAGGGLWGLAESQRIAGVVVLAAGGALIVAGIARLGVVASRR